MIDTEKVNNKKADDWHVKGRCSVGLVITGRAEFVLKRRSVVHLYWAIPHRQPLVTEVIRDFNRKRHSHCSDRRTQRFVVKNGPRFKTTVRLVQECNSSVNTITTERHFQVTDRAYSVARLLISWLRERHQTWSLWYP